MTRRLGNIVRDLTVYPNQRRVVVDGMAFDIIGAQMFEEFYEFVLRPVADHLRSSRAFLRKVTEDAWALYIPARDGREEEEEE